MRTPDVCEACGAHTLGRPHAVRVTRERVDLTTGSTVRMTLCVRCADDFEEAVLQVTADLLAARAA